MLKEDNKELEKQEMTRAVWYTMRTLPAAQITPETCITITAIFGNRYTRVQTR